MICMKKVRFSSRPRAKVRRQGPPGSARAQPCGLHQYYNKNNNPVDQLLLPVAFFEYDSIPERYHMPAIAVIIIYYFRGRHARFLLRGFQGW